MLIHRRVVPRVAKAILRSLRANKLVAVQARLEDEAELAIAASLIDAMSKGAATGEEPTFDAVSAHLVEGLMESERFAEVSADNPTLKRVVAAELTRFSLIDDDRDRAIRAELTGQSEGSQEWEAEYERRMTSAPTR